MRSVSLLVAASLLLAGCGSDFSDEDARAILAKADALQQTAPTIYVPEGKIIREIVGFPDTKRVTELGWVRCVTADRLYVNCFLTPLGRELSRNWKFETRHQWRGWWLAAGTIEVYDVDVRDTTGTTAEVTFYARAVNNELGEEFGRDPSDEGQPYVAFFEKTGAEWKVVDIRQLLQSGG